MKPLESSRLTVTAVGFRARCFVLRRRVKLESESSGVRQLVISYL